MAGRAPFVGGSRQPALLCALRNGQACFAESMARRGVWIGLRIFCAEIAEIMEIAEISCLPEGAGTLVFRAAGANASLRDR